MTPVRIEPVASRSRVKHSTTEQLRSLLYTVGFAAYTYSQFQNSYEFSLDGGVIFDTLVNSEVYRADGVLISGSILSLAFEMKTFCLWKGVISKSHDTQIMQKVIFENCDTIFSNGNPACIVEHFVNIYIV